MLDLKTFFERCYCINLARRQDRWEAFRERMDHCDWPFADIRRFNAVDGKMFPRPAWWRQGGGAWGVYRSNLRIIEDCLMEGVNSVLVLEDDAMPAADFAAKVARYLASIPAGWEQVYLGGQHLFAQQHPPRKINADVVVPHNVNRLHAYGLSRRGMEVAFRHLVDKTWQSKHHIDHHLGVLHQRRGIKVYAPTEWLVGQADGQSDISGHDLPVRFWTKGISGPETNIPTVIAVIGPYRGGTSAVAGAMHHLGIVMGHQFFSGGRAASPRGCFEAKRLFDICMSCYREPSFKEGANRQLRVRLLRGWLNGRRNEQPVIGAKHPKFCLMIPELLEAWPGCKFVVVHRPQAESSESLRKLGWWRSTWKPEDLIKRLMETRDRDVSGVPVERVLHLNFADFLNDTQPALESIARFAEIEPLPEHYQAALKHVDPQLKHYNAECACDAQPQ